MLCRCSEAILSVRSSLSPGGSKYGDRLRHRNSGSDQERVINFPCGRRASLTWLTNAPLCPVAGYASYASRKPWTAQRAAKGGEVNQRDCSDQRGVKGRMGVHAGLHSCIGRGYLLG